MHKHGFHVRAGRGLQLRDERVRRMPRKLGQAALRIGDRAQDPRSFVSRMTNWRARLRAALVKAHGVAGAVAPKCELTRARRQIRSSSMCDDNSESAEVGTERTHEAKRMWPGEKLKYERKVGVIGAPATSMKC
jgi:hypothetical protein